MLHQRLVLVCSLSSILAGCAGLYEQQYPAPVFGGQSGGYVPPAPSQAKPVMPVPPVQAPPPVVKTEPLKDFKQELKPLVVAPPSDNTLPALPGAFPEESPISNDAVTKEPESFPPKTQEQNNLLPGSEPEPQALTPFEPIEPAASSSPAIGSLIIAANQNSQIGNVESAVASIERAIRIEPRNPSLFYKLALLRLKQSKPRLAEDLAKKSALLAAGDNQLKKHSWLLIAHARELQKDFKGAREARAKAAGF
jgi:hypothetical protein